MPSSGPFNARRHRRRPAINITSLIDVMFLLLIFFMVSSTFREQFGVEVDLPEARTSERTEIDSREITVDQQGAYYFGQDRVGEEGLRRSVSEWVARNPDAYLVLRADEAADFGAVLRAIDIAREVGGKRLVLPTNQPAEEAPVR